MWDIMIKQSAKVYNTSQAAAHQLWTKSEQYTMFAAYKNKNTRNGTAYCPMLQLLRKLKVGSLYWQMDLST